jgi:hypothetical protein
LRETPGRNPHSLGASGYRIASGTSKDRKKSGNRIDPVPSFTGRSGTSGDRMYRIIRLPDFFPVLALPDSGNFGYRMDPVLESTGIDFFICVENWQADDNIIQLTIIKNSQFRPSGRCFTGSGA